MKLLTSMNDSEIIRSLNAGGIGVMRTDTLYGVVCRADDEAAVRRVYTLKHRNEAKSPIVLIDSVGQLYDKIPPTAEPLIDDNWPGPVSMILPSEHAPQWIRRDNGSVAYRMPDDIELRALLRAAGPLIAPSANPEGDPPAMNIEQAQTYFGNRVDFYVDGGEVADATPSKLLKVESDGSVERLR